MKKVIFLFLLTMIVPLLNYFRFKYGITIYSTSIYFLVLFVFLRIKLDEVKFSLNFDLQFFKSFGLLTVLSLVLIVLYGDKFTLPDFQIDLTYLFLFISGPFLEELFFRFYLFKQLKDFSPTRIILISSFLFALEHIVHANGLLVIFIYSLIFSAYYYKTKNLLMVYLLHLSHNILTLFIL